MAVKDKHKNFRYPKITLLDFKTVEMDRVLTGFFARIFHEGRDSRIVRSTQNTVDDFVKQIIERDDRFHNFANHPEVVKAWVETHLLDLVNRGRSNEAVAAPRPLHGFTYRFRNPKHCRDYGTAQQIYEMLAHARHGRGKEALFQLKKFFFEGVDSATGKLSNSDALDVETAALLNALKADDMVDDKPKQESREEVSPCCVGSADIMADDIIRLLTYRDVIPRSVLVEYLKILLAFHLALYHLRLLKLLPALVKTKGRAIICQAARCPVKPQLESVQGDCPWKVALFLDAGTESGSRAQALAMQSADHHYRKIPEFIRNYYLAKKLDEWGDDLRKQGHFGTGRVLSLNEVLELLDDKWATLRDQWFGMRWLALREEQEEKEGALDPEIEQLTRLKLSNMDIYVEAITALRMDYHRKFIVGSLDSLMLKNRPGALLAQERVRKAPRRFSLDSRLLEVLLQLAVLRIDGVDFRTEEVKVEELMDFMRQRYGLHLDRLPAEEGFGEPTIQDREALRANKAAFKNKLREIGFFQDLSDAYITQHVTPRYQLKPKSTPAGGAK